MTTNDAQMDLLLRRYARASDASGFDSAGESTAEHLDADELSAFAEGVVPLPARARYVSHLTECGQCRGLVSQLVMATGGVIATETVEKAPAGGSLWEKLAGVFAVNRLRYAAFAMVLIVAAGITFVVLNRKAQETMTAQRSTPELSRGSAIQPTETDKSVNPSGPSQPTNSAPTSPATVTGRKVTDEEAPPPAVAKEDVAKSEPATEFRKSGEVATSAPPFSPTPPGERAESLREKDASGLASAAPPPAPKKAASDELKPAERAGMDQPERGQNMNVQQEQVQVQNEKQKGPNRSRSNQEPLFNNNARRDARDKSSQKQSDSAGSGASNDDGTQDRKAGGHSFRKQGGAWVDSQFKSSMSVTTVKRGSDAFRALDSGLQSIVNQLGGEVLVVWNGKAYRIS